MNKAYLISVSTAAALGWAAGFASEGLVANAAIETAQEKRYDLEVTPQQQATIESWIDSRFCSQINADHGLSGEHGCSGAKSFRRLELDWLTNEDGTRRLRATTWATIRGSWVPQRAD